MRRPAALADKWKGSHEVSVDELESWGMIRLQEEYWSDAIDLVGEYQEIRSSQGDREVSLKALGTTNENMLKYVSGLSTKQIRAHLYAAPPARGRFGRMG